MTLQVGRLHARYRSAAAEALGDAAVPSVAAELEGSIEGGSLTRAYAVCVPDLTVRVRLGAATGQHANARRWAEAILDALGERIRAGDGIVAYERESDALTDLLDGVATGDRTRAWAWRQAGLTSSENPGPDEVATALGRRPELLPAVLSGRTARARRVLRPDGWLHLARRLAASGVALRAGSPTVGHAPGADPRTVPDPTWVTAAARVVPAAAWSLTLGEDHSARALAALALTLVAPARSRDPVAAAQVLTHARAAEERTGVDGPPPGSGPDAAPAALAAAAPPVAQEAPAAVVAGETVPGPDLADPLLATAHGGVLFLVHALTALDVPSRVAADCAGDDAASVIARVLAATTDVALDDPVLAVAAGVQDPETLSLPLSTDATQVAEAVAPRLRAWVADRLGEAPDADLAWVWERHAVLDPAPGWIEATFALEAVDVRIRAAGLDLDPGFVWWLGAVLRFRHV